MFVTGAAKQVDIRSAVTEAPTTVRFLPSIHPQNGAALYDALIRDLWRERRWLGESVIGTLQVDPTTPGRFLIHVWLKDAHVRERFTVIAKQHGYECCVFENDWWYRDVQRSEPQSGRPSTSWW